MGNISRRGKRFKERVQSSIRGEGLLQLLYVVDYYFTVEPCQSGIFLELGT